MREHIPFIFSRKKRWDLFWRFEGATFDLSSRMDEGSEILVGGDLRRLQVVWGQGLRGGCAGGSWGRVGGGGGFTKEERVSLCGWFVFIFVPSFSLLFYFRKMLSVFSSIRCVSLQIYSWFIIPSLLFYVFMTAWITNAHQILPSSMILDWYYKTAIVAYNNH